MKWRILTALILIFFTSCEKGGDEDDTILKFFSENFEDSGNSIGIGEDGYFICGQMTMDNTGKAVIIKAGFDGNAVGEPVTYGGRLAGSASKIIVLTDGSLVCTGYVVDSVSKEKDIIIVHARSDLSTVAQKIYDETPGNQYGVDIIETSEGFMVLGTTDVKREPSSEKTGNAAGKKDILIMRIGKDLEMLSTIPAVGYIGNDEGSSIKPDINGGYIVVGTTDNSDLSSVQSGNNIIIIKVNSDGSTTQPHIVGGLGNEAAADFEVLSDGYLIAGTTGNAGTTQQGYIWKMPVDIYNDPEFESLIDLDESATITPCAIKAMCRYKSNYFLLAGQHGTGLSARLLVFAVDAFGNPVAGQKKITGGNGTQVANDVITDESDNIITIGSNSYEDNSMICFLKFRF